MKDYLRRVTQFFGLVSTVPFLIAFVGAWSVTAGLFLFIFGIPVTLIVLIVGSIAWFVRSYNEGKNYPELQKRVPIYAVAPILLVTTISIAWPLSLLGSYTGTIFRLVLNRYHYEAIIAKVQAHPEKRAWFESDNGVTYSVDRGPPIRVAFNPEGILDNWSGIIYDPTGDVMLADGFDEMTGKFAAPDRVTKLFNGDLVRCRRLLGNYYDCSFT